MNKQEEALKKVADLEQEITKLKKIIEEPEDYISLGIDTYEKVCKELGEKELTLSDFNHLPEYLRHKNLIFSKLQQIGKLFNGEWKVNLKDNNQRKYYPYFEIKSGGGLVYFSSVCACGRLLGCVVYFKDDKTATYVGKNFINLYKELYS